MSNILVENDKIFIRKLKVDDNLYNYLCWMNDDDTVKYLRKRKKQTIDDLKNYIKDNLEKDNYLCGIYRKTDEVHVGNILLSNIDIDNKNCDIGIFIGKDYWGTGIGTSSVVMMSDYAFNTLKVHKIIAGVVEGNTGSAKLFEKAGFTLDGIKKEEFKLNDEYLNIFHYGKINNIK